VKRAGGAREQQEEEQRREEKKAEEPSVAGAAHLGAGAGASTPLPSRRIWEGAGSGVRGGDVDGVRERRWGRRRTAINSGCSRWLRFGLVVLFCDARLRLGRGLIGEWD
jgi:hypothetical protein